MNNFTTITYQMKRDIINFSKKISKNSSKPQIKFTTDMIYGILKSKDVLLSSIADALQEKTKKLNTINRLSDNLTLDIDKSIDDNYCKMAMDSFGDNPVFLIDDSDVIKPQGEMFEALGVVRDGSSKNKNYEKGYHHTEIVGVTEDMKQPISVFSKIHSSAEKEYKSANTITFEGIDKVCNMLEERKIKGIFVNDRGYDSNEIFRHYYKRNQYFVIRLKENRKVYRNHKWYKITALRDAYKGKVKMDIFFQGEQKECKISTFKVKITAEKKWVNLLIVYGLGEKPMMLASNITIKNKEDLIKTVRLYIDRWKIEEYFKFKKQEYHFENFRVRTLKAINNLNAMITYAIGLLGLLSEKMKKRLFVQKIIKESRSLKEKVCLWYYQIARGTYNILKQTKSGIREWQEIRKVVPYEHQLSLI